MANSKNLLAPWLKTCHNTGGPGLFYAYEVKDSAGNQIGGCYMGDAEADLLLALPDLFEDLKVAAETLRRYESLHRAKGTEDSLEKAEANRLLAMRFEATLAKAAGEQT